jgi:T5SS/PEP-CTERM-associated repeat protein
MHRMRRGCLIAGLFVWVVIGSCSSEAQYSANFQTNLVSGVVSNWSGDYLVGSNTFADGLLIQNSGVLSNGNGYLGYEVSSSNDSVLVTGTNSVWNNAGGLVVGFAGPDNRLVISNGGVVADSFLIIGNNSTGNYVSITDPGSTLRARYLSIGVSAGGNSLVISNGGHLASTDFEGGDYVGLSSSNNTAVVTGTGSVWSISGGVVVGDYGSSNTLIIKDGGQMVDRTTLEVGAEAAGSNNSVLVTGTGSVVTASIFVGESGSGNQLVVTDGGVVSGSVGRLGGNLFSVGNTNTARVTNGGSWLINNLSIGYAGSSNSLVVAGGAVYAVNAIVGMASPACDNLIEVDSGNLTVTNAGAIGVLEVRYGELILAGGTVQADTLVITNSCAQFIHTGGALIVGNIVLDTNTFRITSIAQQGNDMLITWLMAPGATNALQAAVGAADGSYTTNGFSDIFMVTNNTTVGTVTNYLDLGAATSTPARYYRARLVP